MKSITLIGYMCSGKTTVGRALARRLHRNFYDLDWYIEERFHHTVPEIFATDGEAHFRDLERRMLHEVAEFEDIVLSCGGGTPCFFDNMDYLNQTSEVVYLRATADILCQHIAMSRGERPLLKGKSPEELHAFVEGQLKEREPFYMRAHHVINLSVLDTTDKVDVLAADIVRAVGL